MKSVILLLCVLVLINLSAATQNPDKITWWASMVNLGQSLKNVVTHGYHSIGRAVGLIKESEYDIRYKKPKTVVVYMVTTPENSRMPFLKSSKIPLPIKVNLLDNHNVEDIMKIGNITEKNLSQDINEGNGEVIQTLVVTVTNLDDVLAEDILNATDIETDLNITSDTFDNTTTLSEQLILQYNKENQSTDDENSTVIATTTEVLNINETQQTTEQVSNRTFKILNLKDDDNEYVKPNFHIKRTHKVTISTSNPVSDSSLHHEAVSKEEMGKTNSLSAYFVENDSENNNSLVKDNYSVYNWIDYRFKNLSNNSSENKEQHKKIIVSPIINNSPTLDYFKQIQKSPIAIALNDFNFLNEYNESKKEDQGKDNFVPGERRANRTEQFGTIFNKEVTKVDESQSEAQSNGPLLSVMGINIKSKKYGAPEEEDITNPIPSILNRYKLEPTKNEHNSNTNEEQQFLKNLARKLREALE